MDSALPRTAIWVMYDISKLDEVIKAIWSTLSLHMEKVSWW
ncbi:rCG23268 [Rattus norvegicus]|uniref:RCG23268 n=1 Tax=Rattus norvegicus TaxID=10116 RepID=A6JQ48_RAT|nr:rCG23268 [Rattus norvegicus]